MSDLLSVPHPKRSTEQALQNKKGCNNRWNPTKTWLNATQNGFSASQSTFGQTGLKSAETSPTPIVHSALLNCSRLSRLVGGAKRPGHRGAKRKARRELNPTPPKQGDRFTWQGLFSEPLRFHPAAHPAIAMTITNWASKAHRTALAEAAKPRTMLHRAGVVRQLDILIGLLSGEVVDRVGWRLGLTTHAPPS